VVRLSNGRTLEGVVVTQSADRVTLDVGTGQIHLRRAQVAAIQTTGVARVESDWQDRYFLHARFVPTGCTNMAERLRRLQEHRRSAQAAAADLLRLRAESGQSVQQAAAGQADRSARQARLQAVDTNAVAATREAWQAYAQEIAAFNAAQARDADLADRQREIVKLVAAAQAIEAEYLRALDDAEQDLVRLRSASAGDADQARFVGKAEALLAECRQGVARHQIHATWEGGHAVLEVQLNGKASGRMLLDTGASTIVMAESLARRAGATPDTNRTVRMQLADSRVITGWPVTLASVQVGDARLTQVAAIVLPSEPSPGIEGLLGMSFLREFTVRVDMASGRVELLELQAPPASR
jgi:clan AA aspartic protease (TIGR02281 family)